MYLYLIKTSLQKYARLLQYPNQDLLFFFIYVILVLINLAILRSKLFTKSEAFANPNPLSLFYKLVKEARANPMERTMKQICPIDNQTKYEMNIKFQQIWMYKNRKITKYLSLLRVFSSFNKKQKENMEMNSFHTTLGLEKFIKHESLRKCNSIWQSAIVTSLFYAKDPCFIQLFPRPLAERKCNSIWKSAIVFWTSIFILCRPNTLYYSEHKHSYS